MFDAELSKTQPTHKLSHDEIKREDAYRLAEDIDNQLVQMSDSLKDTIEHLNKSTARSMDPQNPVRGFE